MPFEIGPDPRFLWLGSKHKEAYAVLRYGILESKGFVVIAGEPGTGKSTLLNATIAAFDKGVRFAKINDPALNAMDFFNFAADALEMGREFQSKGEFLIHLRRFIREAGPDKLVLVIDEAQRTPPDMLEQIRIFTDSDDPERKVLSCVFAGQPELLGLIKNNKALSQRIFFSHTIQTLTLPETEEYISHRLKVAGTKQPLFTPAAIKEIHRLSGGVPRLINILCDQGLLTGYASIRTRIDADMIRECIESTQIPLQTVAADPPRPSASAAAPIEEPKTTVPAAPTPSAQTGRRRASFACVGALACLGLAALVYYQNRSTRLLEDTGPPADLTQAVNQIADLKRDVNAAETRRETLQVELSALKRQLLEMRGAQEQAAERQREMQQKDARIDELQHKVDAAGQSAAKQIAALQTENSRLQTRLEEIDRQTGATGAMADQVGKLEAAAGRTAEREKELRQQLEQSDVRQSAMAKQLESVQKEMLTLQSQLAEAARQKALAETRLADQQRLNTADAKLAKTATEKVAQMEAALAEIDKKQTRLETASGALEKALAAEKTANAQLKGELASNQASAADVRKKYEGLKSQLEQSEADTRKAVDEAQRLQSQLKELKPRPGTAPSATVPALPPPKPLPTAPPAVAPEAYPPQGPDPGAAIEFVLKRKSQ